MCRQALVTGLPGFSWPILPTTQERAWNDAAARNRYRPALYIALVFNPC